MVTSKTNSQVLESFVKSPLRMLQILNVSKILLNSISRDALIGWKVDDPYQTQKFWSYDQRHGNYFQKIFLSVQDRIEYVVETRQDVHFEINLALSLIAFFIGITFAIFIWIFIRSYRKVSHIKGNVSELQDISLTTEERRAVREYWSYVGELDGKLI